MLFTGEGGALYSALSNSGMTIVDSVFMSNVALLYGGAIYVGEQHARTMAVVNSTVTHNRAERAGGGYSTASTVVCPSVHQMRCSRLECHTPHWLCIPLSVYECVSTMSTWHTLSFFRVSNN